MADTVAADGKDRVGAAASFLSLVQQNERHHTCRACIAAVREMVVRM